MRPLLVGSVMLVLAVIAVPPASAADAGIDGGSATSSLPACVQVATESRYVPYGYNHLVRVHNGCSKRAECKVSTDVSPDVQTALVAPSTTVEVTTYLGANSQAFVARVSCTLK